MTQVLRAETTDTVSKARNKVVGSRGGALGGVLVAFLAIMNGLKAANRGAAYQILGNHGQDQLLENELKKFETSNPSAKDLRNPGYLRANALKMMELQNDSIDITNSNSIASNEIQNNDYNEESVGDLARSDAKMIFEDVRSR